MVMAKHGNVRHIKRLSAPQFFGVHRKGDIYVTKPNAGRHTLKSSIALVTLLKKLSLASRNVDAERIIRSGSIHVNSRAIKEPNYPIGLNDAIEIAGEDKYYKIGINNRGQIAVDETKKPNYDSMLFKVTGKYRAKGNAIMLRLHDGRVVKGNADVKINDSVTVDLKDKVTKVLKLGDGAQCMVVDGVHAGTSGKITGITAGTLHRRHSVLVQRIDGKEFETLVKNVMVTE